MLSTIANMAPNDLQFDQHADAQPGEIHGSVWSDLDGNGQWDAGEPGLANWKTYVDENRDGHFDHGEPYALTNANGDYSITGLSEGTYVLAEVGQDGWQQTFPAGAGTGPAAPPRGQRAAPPQSPSVSSGGVRREVEAPGEMFSGEESEWAGVDTSWIDGSGPSALRNLSATSLDSAEPLAEAAPPKGTGVFRVYVEQGLLSSIDDSINTYTADLTAEGYEVAVQEFSGSAAELRSELQRQWIDNALEGALLVGDIPYVDFTSEDDYSSPQQVTYPHDLYFMDLDGSYAFHSGGLDEHTAGSGDVGPEIYVARISTANLGGVTGREEAALINDYFAKVHAYRTGTLDYGDRGTVFADDDWDHWGAEQMANLYSDVLEINDPADTTKQGYLDALQRNDESILECLHSTATSHRISGDKASISSREIFDANPRPGFYNLFNCSAARFTSDDYLAGVYVYGGDYGLSAVGSTKAGSMLNFPRFYLPQGDGASVGQAFTYWFELYAGATDVPRDDWMIDWFNGMTMQGDPTLRPAAMPGGSPGTHTVELQPGQIVGDIDFGSRRIAPAEVAGRYIFYNDSCFDGNDPAANAPDDDAMATDRAALMPGDTATFANYTSYSHGINGVMIDVDGLPGTPGTEDFQFKVGNHDNPDTWSTPTAVPTVTVRRGDGTGGSDRVTLTWNNNAICNQWLQVTVSATAATGLAQDDVFYFGNAVAETGNSPNNAKVDAFDVLTARNNPRNFLDPAPIDFNCDFNRDARVNAIDVLIARNNQTHFLNALKLIYVPELKAAAREPARPLPGRGNGDWLVEFEQTATRNRPADREHPSQGAVDKLLATCRL